MYDLSSFADEHPAGAESITRLAGTPPPAVVPPALLASHRPPCHVGSHLRYIGSYLPCASSLLVYLKNQSPALVLLVLVLAVDVTLVVVVVLFRARCSGGAVPCSGSHSRSFW